MYLFFERKVGHAFRQLDFNVAKEVAISQKKNASAKNGQSCLCAHSDPSQKFACVDSANKPNMWQHVTDTRTEVQKPCSKVDSQFPQYSLQPSKVAGPVLGHPVGL